MQWYSCNALETMRKNQQSVLAPSRESTLVSSRTYISWVLVAVHLFVGSHNGAFQDTVDPVAPWPHP
jgi:hypothetical protein